MDSKTFTEQVARAAGLDKSEATAMLASFADIIASRCSEMDSVSLPGFGTFEPRKRMERIMVMPTTGRRMLLPPKVVLSFKPSALLKQRLRELKNTKSL